MMKWFSSSGT
jgi:hypothetical protein